jgi:hypothetical protein
MKLTEQTKRHVIATYVRPARMRGESTVQVRVGNVQRELGWTNRSPSVFSTLSSMEFQEEAGVELIEKIGGPASGGPSTTVQFVYRLLDGAAAKKSGKTLIPNGAGLDALYGIFSEAYGDLGGGEAYLQEERKWEPDAWEKYERADKARKEKRR